MVNMHRQAAWVAVFLFLLCPPALAFDGHTVTEGPLTLAIGPIPVVTAYDTPQEFAVTLKNSGDQPWEALVELRGLVDPWRAVGPSEARVTVERGGVATTSFRITAPRGCYSAHYPVHVYAALRDSHEAVAAHAVRVFETRFPPSGGAAGGDETPPVIAVPAAGALPLASVAGYRVSWAYYDRPLVRLPVGWQGSDPTSRATFRRGEITRGATRNAIQMHPPYRPGGGTIFVEYRLRLPKTAPLRLVFYNAIRDHRDSEPPSDGVTFRVWADEAKLYERHTDAKRWVRGEADLSQLAGKEILLRLESDPGPRRDTTCDESYWGDPAVIAGNAPAPLTADEKRALADRAAEAIRGAAPGENLFVFQLGRQCRAAIALGRHGLADAALVLGAGDRVVTLDGVQMAVEGQRVGEPLSGVSTQGVRAEIDPDGRLHIVHRLRKGDRSFDLTALVWPEPPGLRMRIRCPERITDLSLGPADRLARSVYFGHGFCVAAPEAFRVNGGGHSLSTSHVGFDFAGGASLLVACDTPPDFLQVDPRRRVYALHAHPDTTFTLTPGLHGAMDCAREYRPLFDKQPAPAVARKAGRFCFDLWGGRYAENDRLVQRAFDYGLTDSIVILHSWQRWGYDYRLPDIYPPNSELGSLEELQSLSRRCAQQDVPFGLHDNYIDFYPDAEDFSYEHIVFTPSGQPQKAWINTGRDAQSYRWRPDHIQPFVERNLRLIQPGLQPTAYFIDVFTSANSFDYFDCRGEFHSKLQTRRAWGEAFAWIRNQLGGQAPMCSEAGGDHLIGYVDGADCQFLQIGPQPQRYHLRIPCRDWERVPWFDLVNHTRFSLHGVGYSTRYQGGRSRALHGIESDDYLSAEMLTGHALMMDRSGLVRGAVRKYWLAQDLIRSLALDEIEEVELAGGDIHRAIVRWKSGARVYVNRGASDWSVAGRTLPQFGYYAASGEIASSVERLGGAVVERSSGPGRFYVNGRGFSRDPPLPIRPSAAAVEYLGDRKFKLLVDWDAKQPAPKDLVVYVHFFQPQVSRLTLTGFVGGGGWPKTATSQWRGRITTGADWVMSLPDPCPPGQYDILVGLYDPASRGRRYRLLGDEDPQSRCRIGKLIVRGDGAKVTGLQLKKAGPLSPLADRLRPNPNPTDFGVAQTAGAVRCVVQRDRLTLTPLPDSDAFPITLRLDKILNRPARVRDVRSVDVDGNETATIDFRVSGSEVALTTRPEDFAYEVRFEE